MHHNQSLYTVIAIREYIRHSAAGTRLAPLPAAIPATRPRKALPALTSEQIATIRAAGRHYQLHGHPSDSPKAYNEALRDIPRRLRPIAGQHFFRGRLDG